MGTYMRVCVSEVIVPGRFLAWQDPDKFMVRNATDDEIEHFFDGSDRTSICGLSTVLACPGEAINMMIEGHFSCPTS
jgi:hypothetical protein